MSTSTTMRPLTRTERERLIYTARYLEEIKHSDVLRKMHEKRKSPYTPEWEALWSGMCALRSEAYRCIQEARDSGQLLFCFEGTTVLKGCAA